MKVSCTVWSRGKDGDNIKVLPIAIVADRISEIMLGVFKEEQPLTMSGHTYGNNLGYKYVTQRYGYD